VINDNMIDETNQIVEHILVGILRSHRCYHKLTYHDQVNMSYHKLTNHTQDNMCIAKMRS
jgi:hypothetical protein